MDTARKYVVQYSGGMSSFMCAYLLSARGDDFDLLFADTNCEDADLYRFNADVERYFGKKIIRLDNEGMDIWDAQIKVKMQANTVHDSCSRVLKREPLKKYIKENYSPNNTVLVFGIGGEEKHRTKSLEFNYAPYKCEFPLIDAGVRKLQIEALLDEIGIDCPRLYEFNFPHNNCGGFCVKAGQKQAALLYKHFPQTYAYHEDKQEAMFATLGAKHGTIRKQINGEMHYLSLKDFRLILQSGEQPDLFDEGGCACV
jgi:3'-phosphoadenosine 5'-phosphosulfate sulfotransferase (PAPS reductase)/FAD synthetase